MVEEDKKDLNYFKEKVAILQKSLDHTNNKIDELTTKIDELTTKNDELTKKNDKLIQANELLQYQLNCLLRGKFGQKSEKCFTEEEPLLLDDMDAEESQEPELKTETTSCKAKKSNLNGRRIIPKSLVRIPITYDIPEANKICDCGCGCKLHKIGEVVSEQLERIPARLCVIRHIRFKYAGCANSNKIITATMPEQAIYKGLAGPGLLASVLVKKYDDHIPLYRQSEILAREAIEIPRSTLCDWVHQSISRLDPLVTSMREDLLKAPKIHTDDTTVPVLDKEKKKAKNGRLWVYLGCGGNASPNVIYDYTATRSQQGPLEFLKGYNGYIQADAYAGYDALFKEGQKDYNIIEVGCMAHTRRKFFDVAKNCKNKGSAHKAIAYISKLYNIEREAKEFTDDARKTLREKRSKPILDDFKAWLDKQVDRVLPKTPLGQAIRYALNQWQALTNYLDHGMLNIDNNAAERLMKPVVVGRKNWMFAGNDKKAKNTAIIYSLIETCKLNKINPYDYLRDVLIRLPTQKNKDIKELLPYNWKAKTDNSLSPKTVVLPLV